MAAILIGRKELFSFAERHSSRRMHDYTDLADGEVLCCLFNAVFPELRIRPAPAQTYSTTQRTHSNWEALFRRCARLRIPLVFLRPAALHAGDVECGFTTLALFFFLRHLSQRVDYSAEFALDVADDVIAFLQSTDCVTTLLLGGALEWAAVPEPLARTLRCAAAFHTTAAEEAALEEEAVRAYRSVIPRQRRRRAIASRTTSAARRFTSRTGAAATGPTAAAAFTDSPPPRPPPPLRGPSVFSSASSAPTSHRSSNSSMAESEQGEQHRGQPRHAPPPPRHASPSPSSSSSSRAADSGAATSASHSSSRASAASERVRYRAASTVSDAATASTHALEAALQSKSEECESLQMRVAQLLTALASKRASTTAASGTSAPVSSTGRTSSEGADEDEDEEEEEDGAGRGTAQRRCGGGHITDERRRPTSRAAPPPLAGGGAMSRAALEVEIAALAEGTDGSATRDAADAVVDVHATANLLHCLLLEHLHDSPHNREQMQRWLWSIVAAHHTVEGRLVAAVDLLRRWRDTLPPADHTADHTTTTADGVAAAAAAVDCRSTVRAELEALHAREHQLREALHALQAQQAATVRRAVHRERLWKALCASVYAAEQTSFALTDCSTAAEVETRLRQREEHYGVVEALTQQLVEDGSQDEAQEERTTPAAATTTTTAAAGPCASLQALVSQLLEERAELLKDVARLHEALSAQEAARSRGSAAATTAATPATAAVVREGVDVPREAPAWRPPRTRCGAPGAAHLHRLLHLDDAAPLAV